MKKLVMDLDNTISINKTGNYSEATPIFETIEKMREYKEKGFYIVISSSRNMRTYEGNIGKINVHTLPTIIEWLDRNNVPYDEVYIGKTWCGTDGFYVDDRAIRPKELVSLSYEEIKLLLEKDKL